MAPSRNTRVASNGDTNNEPAEVLNPFLVFKSATNPVTAKALVNPQLVEAVQESYANAEWSGFPISALVDLDNVKGTEKKSAQQVAEDKAAQALRDAAYSLEGVGISIRHLDGTVWFLAKELVKRPRKSQD